MWDKHKGLKSALKNLGFFFIFQRQDTAESWLVFESQTAIITQGLTRNETNIAAVSKMYFTREYHMVYTSSGYTSSLGRADVGAGFHSYQTEATFASTRNKA